MNVLLAIPVYNEEATVREVLASVQEALPEAIREIYLINDGSTDGSAAQIDSFVAECSIARVLHRSRNEGYGATMIESFRYAKEKRYDYVITMDCDRQHRPEDLIRFIDVDSAVDVVSGSRYLRDSARYGEAPEERVLVNRKITERLNRRYGWDLTDAFCGFKRYRVQSIDPAVFETTGYAFPMEFWVWAYRNRLRIEEIAVSRIYTTDDRSFGEDLDRMRKRYRYYLETWNGAESRFGAAW